MQHLFNFEAYAGYLDKIDGNADVYCRYDTLALGQYVSSFLSNKIHFYLKDVIGTVLYLMSKDVIGNVQAFKSFKKRTAITYW